MSLQHLRPLLSVPADWICLQKEIPAPDQDAMRAVPQLRFVGDELHDFADTAALIQSLDLVIAIDTGVAHLAGAMGKPVWIMLLHAADWRWLARSAAARSISARRAAMRARVASA